MTVYILYAAVFLLSISVAVLASTANSRGKRLAELEARLNVAAGIIDRHGLRFEVLADDLTGMSRKVEVCTRKIEVLDRKYAKVDEVLDAHAEAEAEAAKSERLFQEGLNNILNYGVKSSG